MITIRNEERTRAAALSFSLILIVILISFRIAIFLACTQAKASKGRGGYLQESAEEIVPAPVFVFDRIQRRQPDHAEVLGQDHDRPRQRRARRLASEPWRRRPVWIAEP